MNSFHVEEIERIIKAVREDEDGDCDGLYSVIYSLGRDAENKEEYDFAFSKLTELFHIGNISVKARVVQAFSLLAVLKKEIKILDRACVEPLILSAYLRSSGSDRQIIQDAIDDINHSLNWD